MADWHPPLVHLPLVLLLLWVPIDAAGFFGRRPQVSQVGFALLLLAFPATLLATVSGQAAFDQAIAGGFAPALLERHSEQAELLPWLVLVLAALRAWAGQRPRGARVLALLLGLALAGLALRTGRTGGALVFEHGVGVHAPPR